jgi:putative transferase (TIGR04331 family)
MQCLVPVRVKKENIPKKINTLLLGTWALNYGDIENKNNHKIVSYHYDNFYIKKKDYLYSKALYFRMIPVFTNLLNKHHNLEWSEKSIKIYFGSWLLDVIQVVLDRYKSIENATNNYDFDKCILTNSSVEILSGFDFRQEITTDRYNHVLYSKIIKIINKELYKKSIFINYECNYKKINKDSLIRKYLQSLFFLITKNSRSIVDSAYFRKKDFIELVLKSFPNITPIFFTASLNDENIKKDYTVRDKLKEDFSNNFVINSKFEEVLLEILFEEMPYVFIEGLDEIKIKSKNINITNKNIYSANRISNNDVFKFFVANQLSDNKIIIGQHGGSYGICEWSSLEFYEREIADIYITYGWEDTKAYKTIPISHPKMIVPKKCTININKILYVLNNFPRYFNRNVSNPSAGNGRVDYFKNIKLFIENISVDAKTNFYVRLNPHDYSTGVKKYLSGLDVNYSEEDFYTELCSASLVICDNNQTTFLESLALNKPTIIFWNKKYWKIRDAAKEDFIKLKNVGVYYDNYKEAVLFMNKLIEKNEVSKWWLDKKRQKVIREFTYKYAKENTDWAGDYLKLLA